MMHDPLFSLASDLVCLAKERDITFAFAESCTGGLVASTITRVPGASACFFAGLVTYSNEAKANLLGVDPAVIAANGAVSEPVARAMASGARKRAEVTLAGSVTGIAGPGGGSAKKPVGLVYLGVDFKGEVLAERHIFAGSRDEIRARAASVLLQLMIDQCHPT